LGLVVNDAASMTDLSHSIPHPWRRLALLLAACVLLTAAVTWGVYDAIPHLEDEHAQLFQAKVFASGRITAPLEGPALSFSIPFTLVRGGQAFSKYPPGFALLLAPGALLGQPWLMNVLMAALGILGVYALGRDLFGEPEGLLAAGLGVISPMFVMLAGTLLPHTAELALLIWFSWAFFRARRMEGESARLYALAAGGLVGLALTVRPLTAAAVGLPFAGLALADVLRDRRRLNLYLGMLGGFILGALIWPVYNWVAAGSPLADTYRLYWPYDGVGFGPQFGRSGHTLLEGLNNVYGDLFDFDTMAMGWPAWGGIPVMWVVVGLGLALPRRVRWEGFLLLPAAALILAQSAYWTRSAGLYGPRYFAEAMPFVWLLAARGLLKTDALLRARVLRVGLRLLLALWVAWSTVFLIYPHMNQARDLYDISRADADIMAQADLKNALVFVETRTWTDYARLSWLNAIDAWQGEVIYARDMGRNLNLAVHNLYPGRAVYRFDRRANPPLTACPDPCGLFP